MATRSTISPRQLAQVVGVSESSIKRWADSGRIHVSKTAGGHRRIPLQEAVRFIRSANLTVQDPDLLGIPGLDPVPAEDPSDPSQGLADALERGEASRVRSILTSLYVGGTSLPTLFDGPLTVALEHVGKFWLSRDDGIFIEHRATDISVQALAELRAMVRPASPIGRSLGGAAKGDTSFLPCLMVATVLASEGFDAVSFGADLPVESLFRAVDFERPDFVWWSVNHIENRSEVQAELERLEEGLARRELVGVVGGRALSDLELPRSAHLMPMDSLAELAAFAHGRACSAQPA